MNPESILRILDRPRCDRTGLISILEDIQAETGHLALETLRIVSKRTGRSLADIFGLATFHRSLRLQPRGFHLVSVCMGTACHVRRSAEIAEEWERKLGVKSGETTADGQFTLATVNCLGACALGPVVTIDGEFHRNFTVGGVRRMLTRLRRDRSDLDVSSDERVFHLAVGCPQCNRSLMDPERPIGGLPSVRLIASFADKHCSLWLSGLYGDYRIESQEEIPSGSIAHFFCPRCHSHFRSTRLCPRCDAPMIPLNLQGGGVVVLCSRRGCKEHLLDLSG